MLHRGVRVQSNVPRDRRKQPARLDRVRPLVMSRSRLFLLCALCASDLVACVDSTEDVATANPDDVATPACQINAGADSGGLDPNAGVGGDGVAGAGGLEGAPPVSAY